MKENLLPGVAAEKVLLLDEARRPELTVDHNKFFEAVRKLLRGGRKRDQCKKQHGLQGRTDHHLIFFPACSLHALRSPRQLSRGCAADDDRLPSSPKLLEELHHLVPVFVFER